MRKCARGWHSTVWSSAGLGGGPGDSGSPEGQPRASAAVTETQQGLRRGALQAGWVETSPEPSSCLLSSLHQTCVFEITGNKHGMWASYSLRQCLNLSPCPGPCLTGRLSAGRCCARAPLCMHRLVSPRLSPTGPLRRTRVSLAPTACWHCPLTFGACPSPWSTPCLPTAPQQGPWWPVLCWAPWGWKATQIP